MLPLFGPSNLRAAIGRIPGSYTSYPRYIDDTGTAIAIQGTEIIAFRAELLGTDNLLDEAALDPYVFLRDFWSRRHRTRVLQSPSSATSCQRQIAVMPASASASDAAKCTAIAPLSEMPSCTKVSAQK